MESQVRETSSPSEGSAQGDRLELTELRDLQLALAGGGCAEVCPY